MTSLEAVYKAKKEKMADKMRSLEDDIKEHYKLNKRQSEELVSTKRSLEDALK